LLEAWKQTLNASHTVAKFPDWQRLAVQVAADIGHFLLERQFGARLSETAAVKGVPEAPLREVLKRLGETEVVEGEIPQRLAGAADELLRLRADLEKLRNDRPEFAAIRARASALIDEGDFDGARAALREGRQRARETREEMIWQRQINEALKSAIGRRGRPLPRFPAAGPPAAAEKGPSCTGQIARYLDRSLHVLPTNFKISV
jgi:hypothetical protein